MVKHTQTICRQFAHKLLSMIDSFMGLALKGLIFKLVSAIFGFQQMIALQKI